MAGEAENDPGEAVTRAKLSTSSLCSTLYTKHTPTPIGFQNLSSHIEKATCLGGDLIGSGSLGTSLEAACA